MAFKLKEKSVELKWGGTEAGKGVDRMSGRAAETQRTSSSLILQLSSVPPPLPAHLSKPIPTQRSVTRHHTSLVALLVGPYSFGFTAVPFLSLLGSVVGLGWQVMSSYLVISFLSSPPASSYPCLLPFQLSRI